VAHARSSSPPTATRASRPYADEVIRIPDAKSLLTPLLTLVPMQVLSAEIARVRGLDVDQPRNLAKSVTVE
jgi:glucosamine--fructose-6-phosphate aminotransferase (isomerizing)